MRIKALLFPAAAMLVAVGLPALASPPVAFISSSAPVTLNGHSVNTAEICIGNEVATSTAPATLLFPDGSSVILAPASRARLTGTLSQPKLILLGGALDYKVVLGSNLSVTTLDLERQIQTGVKSVPHPAKPIPPCRPDEITLTALPQEITASMPGSKLSKAANLHSS